MRSFLSSSSQRRKRSGFTLIELLVVITIIGILATGATATYTSQIQKSRDSTRVSDVKALQSSVEQYYQDTSVYPPAYTVHFFAATGVIRYMSKIPSDGKLGETCSKHSSQPGSFIIPCGYAYNVAPDDNNIQAGAYELSVAFENRGNVDTKAYSDDNGGSEDTNGVGKKDASRLEVGIRTKTGINTKVRMTPAAVKGNAGSCSDTAVKGIADTASATAVSDVTAENGSINGTTGEVQVGPPIVICGNNN